MQAAKAPLLLVGVAEIMAKSGRFVSVQQHKRKEMWEPGWQKWWTGL